MARLSCRANVAFRRFGLVPTARRKVKVPPVETFPLFGPKFVGLGRTGPTASSVAGPPGVRKSWWIARTVDLARSAQTRAVVVGVGENAETLDPGNDREFGAARHAYVAMRLRSP